MIPLKLSIENFMCYQSNVPTLDFDLLHVSCISGENGHGKTAILDAITWVLWGKSRTRTQEELVNQKSDHMSVSLDFSIDSDKYRVARKFSKTSSQGKTELNFFLLNESEATSIMGNTIKDTQEKIIDVIHMNYETFINTSYLKQGNSDNFSKSTPSDRKKILSEVLNLEFYENISNQAKETSRQLNENLNKNNALLSLRKEDLLNPKEISKSLKNKRQQLTEIEDEIANLKQNMLDLQNQKTKLSVIEQKQITNLSLIQTNEKDIESLNDQVENWNKESIKFQKILQQTEKIQSNVIILNDYQKQVAELSETFSILRDLEKQQSEQKHSIDLEKQKKQIDLKTLQETYRTLKTYQEITIPKIESDLKNAEIKLKDLNKSIILLDKNLDLIPEINSKIALMEINNASLKNIMTDTRQKFDLLQTSNNHCPLCSQSLNEQTHMHIEMELKNLGQNSQEAFLNNQKEIDQYKDQISKIESENSPQKTVALNEKPMIESEITLLKSKLEEEKKKIINIHETAKIIEDLKLEISGDNFAKHHRAKLIEIDSQIQSLNYDPKIHTQLEQEISRLIPYLDLNSKLLESENNLKSLNSNITISQKKILEKKSQNSELYNQNSKIKKEITNFTNVDNLLISTSTKIDESSQSKQNLISEIIILERDLTKNQSIQNEVLQLETSLKSIQNELEIYQELSAAFGRNGIQALLIEQAVPEIQNNANELIEKLSENKMQILLNLTGGRLDRQTGIPSEELEIKISDEMGIRNYETYSGGESFRIDFAIRIALSKLLASRSGAPLPILFIDEGFGSQDFRGQQTMIEAIQSIRNDFKKIIVITHVDSMKESFEEKIEVFKSPEGSTFQII